MNQPFFAEVVQRFGEMDWGRYLLVMQKLHEHSAAAYLPEIGVPTLITAGGRDRMTPVAVAAHMEQMIPGAELMVIPDATHYVVAEYPELLVRRIQAFLTRWGIGAGAGSPDDPARIDREAPPPG